MHESREHLQTLTEIRSLMERSAKFLSLSGLSGVSAGVIALAGAAVVYGRLQTDWFRLLNYNGLEPYGNSINAGIRQFLVTVALVVLGAALLAGFYFTVRKARRQGQTVWNAPSKRLLWAMTVPLATGGVFCLALLYYNLIWLAFPATLIFYGLALLNGSKYTLRDVESLAYCEIGLGLVSLFWPGYNLLAWTVGFGVLHIIYGLAMYYKYERNTAHEGPAGSV
jgi:predicted lysophospholipase L1 biosynthesis ABC-type transport system permease subunit